MVPPLTEYIQGLIAEQFGYLPDPEVRAQVEEDLMDGAIDLINRRMIEAMSDADVKMFNTMLDGNPRPEAVTAFVERHVPNKEAVVAQALMEFRQYYLGSSR